MITSEELKHLATLSGLYIDDRLDETAKELSEIISVMNKVTLFSENDTHSAQESINAISLRDDFPQNSNSTEEILKNSKSTNGDFFTAQKIV